MDQEVTNLSSHFAVQDRTVVTNDGVDYYAERFENLRQDSTGSVLDLATTLADAEDKLSKEDFRSFCARVGVAAGKSYHKKLRTISKNASRLRPHLRLLPHCWTTIYKLAQMQTGKFNDLVASGGLSPGVTARDIGKFLGEGMNERSTSKDAGRRVVISFGKLDVDTKRRVAAEIYELAGGLLASNSGLDAA
ncbi:hypothetical protein, partial [Methylocystis sp. SB2]